MSNKNLRTQYRSRLMNLHLVTISVISLVELVAYIIFLNNPTYPRDFVRHFLLFNLILPVAINYSAHLVARLLIAREQASDTFRDGTITFAIFITATCISILHRQYLLALCSYAFPIVLCGFFSSRKLLNTLMCLVLVALTASEILILRESQADATLIINLAGAYIFVLISYFSSFLALSFSQSSFFAIQNQAYLQKQIQLDSMTGLYNHRTFDQDLERAVRTYETHATPFCLAVVDIDDFKLVNDTYGHDDGDNVIFALCDALKAVCTADDKVYRYGGEEFAVIFAGKESSACIPLMEQALQTFRTHQFSFVDLPITFSCGMDHYSGNLPAPEFFAYVDELLYAAKKTGKNKIVSPAPDAI